MFPFVPLNGRNVPIRLDNWEHLCQFGDIIVGFPKRSLLTQMPLFCPECPKLDALFESKMGWNNQHECNPRTRSSKLKGTYPDLPATVPPSFSLGHQVAELFCSACESALCEDCVPDHEEHPKVPLSQALEQHRSSLQERLGGVQSRLPQISDALSFVKEILQQLTNQRAFIEEDIQSSFEDLHKQLDVRKSVLLMELEVTYRLKQKVILVSESFTAEQELQERLGGLAGLGLPCQPEENDQLDLLLETDGLRKSIHNLGTIVTTSAVASQSEAMGAGLEQCIVGHPASVTIVTRDKSGGACKSGNAILSAEVFTPDGSIVDGEIVDHKNGTYEFVYTVPNEGDFSLALRLYDQHIKGSPFKLTINRILEAEVEGAKRRGKSPGQKKKGSKRASSALGTPRRKTQNPIEDDLIFRIGATSQLRKLKRSLALVDSWGRRAYPWTRTVM
uniref:RING-type E3 ubiquitin transferase n=1 Tax=Cyclopterus lumpus TaxID=8103 RepID=A0A8C3A0J6_CYCLU